MRVHVQAARPLSSSSLCRTVRTSESSSCQTCVFTDVTLVERGATMGFLSSVSGSSRSGKGFGQVSLCVRDAGEWAWVQRSVVNLVS